MYVDGCYLFLLIWMQFHCSKLEPTVSKDFKKEHLKYFQFGSTPSFESCSKDSDICNVMFIFLFIGTRRIYVDSSLFTAEMCISFVNIHNTSIHTLIVLLTVANYILTCHQISFHTERGVPFLGCVLTLAYT